MIVYFLLKPFVLSHQSCLHVSKPFLCLFVGKEKQIFT